MNMIKVERSIIIIRIIIFSLEDTTYRFVISVYHTHHILFYIFYIITVCLDQNEELIVLLSKIQMENIILSKRRVFFRYLNSKDINMNYKK